MNELLSDLLIAVITAAVPVLTAFAITYIKRVAANVAAETDDVKAQGLHHGNRRCGFPLP